ncbi:MAG: filamentous hemagglutinin N-terminal domain-containing protein, partial [Planctomycetes bacterium]|nr:filamentous hemagglutinin N-terminal domain-containing protein [Planctomycetota bacterium]
AALCAGLTGEPAHADQAGAQIVVGDVTFIHDGYQTIIQASDGSIINYLSFNILPWETIQFIQPHQYARVLNRVTGPEPSVIGGRLLSNGQVYIVNPAGVYFTGGSTVDVAGLYAAAGNITDEDFTTFNDRFSLTGDVVNAGHINGKDVHLMGRRVANHGAITSNGGIITMLAGDDVYISRLGERISVHVDGAELTNRSHPFAGGTTPDMMATPGVENTGLVHNTAGTVVFGAGDLYSLAIRNTGTVYAAGGNVTMSAKDGLVQNDGVISASVDSGQAGSITIQGPSVLNRGWIDAASNHGQGGSVELTSQNHTYLTPGSVVSVAGGTGFAHAGQALIHSYEGQTIFPRGAVIDISGGLAGGYGGFVEVSGKHLIYAGETRMGAMAGYTGGSLLIDPVDIVISTTGPFDPLPASGEILFGDPPALTNLDAGALNIFGGDIHLQATNDITVNAALTLGLFELWLEAGNDIVVNASIDAGSLVFNAGNVIDINAPLTVGTVMFDAVAGGIRIQNSITADTATFTGPIVRILDGTVITTGDQVYNGNLELATNVGDLLQILQTGGTAIFNGTINSQGTIATPSALWVQGNAEFNGD